MIDPKMKASEMDVRSYFAAMAMSALVIHREVQLDHESKLPADVIARMALAQADALIKALNSDDK